jgi:L-asparagine oxygenase
MSLVGTAPAVAVHDLTARETAAIATLVEDVAGRYGCAEDPDFLAAARGLAYRRLPGTLLERLTAFRDREFAAVLTVTGLPVDDVRIGVTPGHWRAQPDPRSTLPEELALVLLGAVLGDPFGWATLQGGRLVQNVLPIRNQEQEQSGHGSLVPLAWHTEDGFHPYRCDYLSLLALRNDDLVPTVVASVDDVELTGDERRVLAQPRFVIRPDDEHLHQRARENQPGAEPLPDDWANPAPTAVLFGDSDRPYLRIDPFFMSAVPGDAEAAAALAAIVDELEHALTDLPLAQGSAAFIDNYRAVHGRQKFQPRYDGRDRWLKKVVLTRDLRKSRAARERPESRVLLTTALDGTREAS